MSLPTPGPVPRATRALSLFVGLAAECSAFVVQSLRPANPFFNIDVAPMQHASGCVRPARRVSRWVCQRRESSPSGRNAGRNLFALAANPERSLGDVWDVSPNTEMNEAATHQEALRKGVVKDSNRSAMGGLEDAFGTGRGKHAGKKRRRHSNKYASKSKAADVDPWEKQLRKSEEKLGEAEARERAELEELEQRRIERRIERGLVEYPDEEEIDPYDPSTFGYIEVGQILGAHGIKGEVKVRSSTDFAVSRLCTPGIKHIKAPNRRFPRDVELLGGRWQKNEIFLLEVQGVRTRDAAAALRGHTVYVLEDEEVELDENEYMVRDLVGGRAFRQDDQSVYIGEIVGVVLGSDISSTAGLASDMLELRLPLENPGDVPKECYIPFVPALVPVVEVDDGNCTILMDLPEGLLDLAVEVEEKVVIRGFLPPGSE